MESDEFYIKSGLKGRSYHAEIIESGGNRGEELSSLGREEEHSKKISQ